MTDTLVEVAVTTIPNIELVSTGTWMASTGEVTFQQADLEAIVASIDDPAVKEPRLILGHTGPTAPPGMSGKDGFFGEQPTIGKFTELRLDEDHQSIFADLVGVPVWLAEILPTAYPNRSVEVYWDVTSASGKKHAAIMPRVAALGINLPAIASLDDLMALYSEEGPEGVQLVHTGERVAASRGDAMPGRTAASTTMEDVRRSFYDDFATEESGRYWWWIKAVFVDPSVIIADDETGALFSIPYSLKDQGAEFGDPVEVFQQYVEKDSGKVAAAKKMTLNALLQGADKIYEDAKASRPTDRVKEEKMARVTFASVDVPALRTRLGLTTEQLPDDASDDQINEAINSIAQPPASANPDAPAAGGEESLTPGPDAQPGDSEPNPPGSTTGPGAPGPEGPSLAEDGTVKIDKATWEATQAAVKRGTALADKADKERREIKVNAAITDRKIPPARKAHYLSLMESDEEGTTKLLDSLEKDAVPGEVPVGSEGEGDPTQAATYDRSWLSPSELSRVEAVEAGTPQQPRVVMEV